MVWARPRVRVKGRGWEMGDKVIMERSLLQSTAVHFRASSSELLNAIGMRRGRESRSIVHGSLEVQ